MRPFPSVVSAPTPFPADLSAQLDYLYSQTEALNTLVKRFITSHSDMQIFNDLHKPLKRLPLSVDLVRQTIDELVQAIRYVSISRCYVRGLMCIGVVIEFWSRK